MRATGQVVIERPVEAVWSWAADPAHWEHWLEEVGQVRVEGELREGARFHGRHLYGGELVEVDYELVERQAPRRQTVRSLDPGFPFEGTLELSAHVRGTRVRQTVVAGPEDALARFVFALAHPLVRRSMRQQIERQLRRLKEMVELEAAL